MRDVCKNINFYNPDKENKILIVFDDRIAEIIHNKKLNSIVTKFNSSNKHCLLEEGNWIFLLFFITQSCFKIPKDVRMNTTHLFIAKIPNKRELREIAINHLSDISNKDFTNIYRECTTEPY